MKWTSVASRWVTIYRQFLAQDIVSAGWQRNVLLVIVFGCLLARLLTIGEPALEQTAWKEIDYLMISTNYWQHGFNFLRPEVSWPAELPRVTEMELPLVPFSSALLYQAFGYSEYTARLVTAIAFLVLSIFVFRLVRKELGPLVGLLAATTSAIMPLYHPFGRLQLTEPLMIAMSVVTLYYVARWVDLGRRRDWLLGLTALSLTIALKIEALYLFLPIAWIAFRRYRWQISRYWGLAGLVTIGLLLPIAWYAYAYYLENIGAHVFGIFRGHDKMQTVTMLRDVGWYREMARRLIFEVSGGFVGSVLVLLGLVAAAWLRRADVFFSYLLAIGFYFILIAEGNLDAPYRQMTIIPVLSVFFAMGILALVTALLLGLESARDVSISLDRRLTLVGASSVLLFALVVGSRISQIRGLADVPNHVYRWEIAQELKQYTAADSKIVVAGEYSIHVGGNDLSPVIYYYSGLQGWTLQPDDWNLEAVKKLASKGATHFIALAPFAPPETAPYLSAPAFIADLRSNYKVLYEDSNRLLLIMDLQTTH